MKMSFPVFTVLGVAFIIMKLAEIGVVAAWSWWWVLSPFWLPFVVFFSVILVGWVIGVVYVALSDTKKRKK